MPDDQDSPQRDSASSGPSLPRRYFEDLYQRAPTGDPWEFRQSPYEAAKYAATLDHLPRPRYSTALEVGCSIGVFTRMLAQRVADLLAIDLAEAALTQARAHCGDQPQVRFALGNPLESIPLGPFELIVVAEVAYYWTPTDLDRVFRELVAVLAPKGQIILVHWRAAVPDYPQTGDVVHEQAASLAEQVGLNHRGTWVEERYRVDLWEKP